MDRGGWWATIHEITKESDHDLVTKQQQNNFIQNTKSDFVSPLMFASLFIITVGNFPSSLMVKTLPSDAGGVG